MYKHLLSRTIQGKQQLIVNSFARALEIIPRQLAENAGIDSTDVLNRSAYGLYTDTASLRVYTNFPIYAVFFLVCMCMYVCMNEYRVFPLTLRLRKEHATAVGEEGRWMGVDVMNEGPHTTAHCVQ